jgi:hypothetical protein
VRGERLAGLVAERELVKHPVHTQVKVGHPDKAMMVGLGME